MVYRSRYVTGLIGIGVIGLIFYPWGILLTMWVIGCASYFAKGLISGMPRA
jgi:hypothetical protein